MVYYTVLFNRPLRVKFCKDLVPHEQNMKPGALYKVPVTQRFPLYPQTDRNDAEAFKEELVISAVYCQGNITATITGAIFSIEIARVPHTLVAFT